MDRTSACLSHCPRQSHTVRMPSTEREAWQWQGCERRARSERTRTCRNHAAIMLCLLPTSTQQTPRDADRTTRHAQKRHALARPDTPHDSMTPTQRQDAATGGTRHATRLCRLCRIGGFSPDRTAIRRRYDRIVTTHGKTTPRKDASDGTHAQRREQDVDKTRTGEPDGLHGN